MSLGRRELFWQPALPHLGEADLVVVNDVVTIAERYHGLIQALAA